LYVQLSLGNERGYVSVTNSDREVDSLEHWLRSFSRRVRDLKENPSIRPRVHVGTFGWRSLWDARPKYAPLSLTVA
jgi:hypothetical protein